jgi:hypothetical protein
VSYTISIPLRERSDSLSDVATATHGLSTDDARVTRQPVLDALVGGWATTAGELLDRLEKASPAERRKMLDDARVKAGLPSATDVEFRERFERDQIAGALKAAHETRPLWLAFSPSGAIVDLNEMDDEAARVRALEASRRQLREAKDGERAVEAAAKRQHDEARDAGFRAGLPPGVPG